MFIKKVYLVLSILSIIFIGATNAQTVKITGKVLDSKGSFMIGAIIQLYDSTGIKITSIISDTIGRFTIQDKKGYGAYLVVSFLQLGSKTIFIPKNQSIIDFGDIILNTNQYSLTEVVVEGKKPPIGFKVDKQVYSAGQFANANNGNGIDIIKNLPAVSVNGLGEISLRGSNSFQIMINGKPTVGDPSFILSQLSATSIQNIEIITSPGASYDADGKSGIINVVTKSIIEKGWMMQSNVMYGAGPFNNYGNTRYVHPSRGSIDVTASYRNKSWDVNIGVN